MSDLSQAELFRYSRHLILPEVGLEGQRKLKSASVLIVGTGGLGSPVAMYLAAAGVGRIGIVDYDVVDDSNLQRQIIHGSDRVGALKVESARRRMLELNPYIEVEASNEVFSASNARQIAQGYDLLIDGTDNFPTRYLLNDLAVLTGRPYVYGSIFRFEGQVSVFDARHGPCYRCLFPEPPPARMVPSCAEGGVFGVLPGTVGTLQATEALKLILGIGEPLIGRLLLYDALDMSLTAVQLRKNPACRVCGEHPTVTGLIDYEQFCGVPTRGHAPVEGIGEMEPEELAARLKGDVPPALLDVREPVETQVSTLPGAQVIPWGLLAHRVGELDRSREWVLFCRTGVRSAWGTQILQEAGFEKVFSLKGGINAWAERIDRGMRRY